MRVQLMRAGGEVEPVETRPAGMDPVDVKPAKVDSIDVKPFELEMLATVRGTAPAMQGRAGQFLKLTSYQIRDVLRSRWILVYGFFFLAATEGLLRFGGGTMHALVSLMNVVLLLVPLVGIVFGTMYLYNARDFVEILLSQPVRRGRLYAGLYAGLAIPLAASFVIGAGVPFVLRGAVAGGALPVMLAAGAVMTLIFVGFAFPIALRFDERVRGLALALGVWLGLSVMYDGAVLAVIYAAADYPLEIPALIVTLLNPVDLARVLLLLQFDVAALMGYTGAVFQQFFGSALGTAVATTALAGWVLIPLLLGMRRFRRKDF